MIYRIRDINFTFSHIIDFRISSITFANNIDLLYNIITLFYLIELNSFNLYILKLDRLLL